MCKPIPLDEYPITPVELIQRYLVGVNLRLPDGCPYPDQLFDFAIRASTEEVERYLGILIIPRTFSGGEIGDLAQMNLLPTEQNENGIYGAERQDWIPYNQYQRTRLAWRPLIGVPTRVRLVLPGVTDGYPEIPPEWISVRDGNAATIDLVPGGNITGFYYTSFFAATQLTWGTWWNTRIPNLLRIDYRAGFLPGCVPWAIQDLIGLFAAIQILNIAGDLIAGAGIASFSLSLGGLSQSIATTSSATNSGYGARIIQYSKQIEKLIKQLRADYVGANLVVV